MKLIIGSIQEFFFLIFHEIHEAMFIFVPFQKSMDAPQVVMWKIIRLSSGRNYKEN